MKALVLGASGQLGQALQAVLEREGIETLPTFHKSEYPDGRQLDVREAEEVRACLDSFKPDVVFMALNTSGGVDACEEAPALADAVIVRGTKNVLAAAA
ncbi:MAG: sugar nucleotide-binding protein, partial [Elusimicrobiota bacterium]